MRYRLVIFDLDGTILDTLGDLAISVNHALAANDMQERSREEVRRFVGNGVEKLIRRAVPEGTDDVLAMKVLNDFRAHYNAHSNDHTKPYEGIVEMLTGLKTAGVKIAVHSNKYDSAVKTLCALHFNDIFDAVAGAGELSPHKPDPAGALTLMRACDAKPEETIYIGDSEVDIATAKNAGIDCGWVSWGFRRADEIETGYAAYHFDTPQAIAIQLIG